MSAEKEVVNFWLNRNGFFTVNNLKSGNKDIGILALKFAEGVLTNVMHVEIVCSISGYSDQTKNLNKLISEKFNGGGILSAIKKYTKHMDGDIKVQNSIVLNSLPKDRKTIMSKLVKNGILLVEFEDVISDVMKEVKTEYFKNDVIRTLQIVKFLLMSNPKKFVDVLYGNLSHSKSREVLAELLNKDDIIKEFKKTNEERLALILKQSMIKPENLAKILEKDVLNRHTRKPFIESLIEQKKIGKTYKRETKVKKEKPLNKFFV